MFPPLKPAVAKAFRRLGIGALCAALAVAVALWLPPSLEVLAHYSDRGGLSGSPATVVNLVYLQNLANPRSAEASGRMGMALQANQQTASALYWYGRAMRLDKENPAWYYCAGRLNLERGDAKAAVPLLRQAVKLGPHYLPAELTLAKALGQSGVADESERLFELLTLKNPNIAAIFQAWGDYLAAQGRWDDAAEEYSRSVSVVPQAGASWYGLAVASRKLGRTEQAQRSARLAERFSRADPPFEDPFFDRIQVEFPTAGSLLAEGIRRQRLGSPRLAIEALRKALTLDPNRREAQEYMIAALGSESRWKEAEDEYRRWAAKYPQGCDGHWRYAFVLAQQSRWAEVRAPLEAAVRANPHSPDALNGLGVLEQRSGNSPKAEELFRTALRESPWFAEAHLNLGVVLRKNHDNEGAQKEFLQALLPDIDDPKRRLLQILPELGATPEREVFLEAVRRQAEREDQTQLLDFLGSAQVARK